MPSGAVSTRLGRPGRRKLTWRPSVFSAMAWTRLLPKARSRCSETGTEEVKCPLARYPHASAARSAQAYVVAQRLFRHGLDAFASQGSFLFQVLADGDPLVIADALV